MFDAYGAWSQLDLEVFRFRESGTRYVIKTGSGPRASKAGFSIPRFTQSQRHIPTFSYPAVCGNHATTPNSTCSVFVFSQFQLDCTEIAEEPIGSQE